MRLVPLVCALLASMYGCSLESAEDTKVKAALAGSWHYEYKDPSERHVRGIYSLAEGGTFRGRERVAGEPREEGSSGPWYVTDGLLKLQTVEVDGRKLGTRETMFFTCKVQDLSSKQFDCLLVDGNRKLTFRKVPHDYALS